MWDKFKKYAVIVGILDFGSYLVPHKPWSCITKLRRLILVKEGDESSLDAFSNPY